MEEKEAFDAYLKNNFDMNPIDILPQDGTTSRKRTYKIDKF